MWIGWWRGCENVSFVLFKRKEIDLLEDHAEVLDREPAKHLDQSIWLFGQEVAFDIDYTFLDLYPCNNESNQVEGIIKQCACFAAWIVPVVTYLTKHEKAIRPATIIVRKYIRILRAFGHLTVYRTCRLVFDCLGTRRTIFCTSSISQWLCSAKNEHL